MTRGGVAWFVGGLSAALALAYLSVVDRLYVHVDHHAATETLRRMRAGQGYYQAMRDTYWVDSGIRLGGPRSFRTPFLFELLRWFPGQWLLPLFVLVVVVGTCVLLADASPHPFAALPVAAVLVVAGRRFGEGRIETWMFLELWAVPALALTYWGWAKQRSWAAALGAAVAALIRELTLPVVAFGLLLVLGRRRERRAWVVALVTAAVGLAVHVLLALRVGYAHGTEAKLLGSGDPPGTVADMMSCGLPFGWGLFLWSLAAVHIVRRRLVSPITPLLALPLFGLLVDRAYWGNLITPFIVLWAGELLGDAWTWRRRTTLAASSPSESTEVEWTTDAPAPAGR